MLSKGTSLQMITSLEEDRLGPIAAMGQDGAGCSAWSLSVASLRPSPPPEIADLSHFCMQLLRFSLHCGLGRDHTDLAIRVRHGRMEGRQGLAWRGEVGWREEESGGCCTTRKQQSAPRSDRLHWSRSQVQQDRPIADCLSVVG